MRLTNEGNNVQKEIEKQCEMIGKRIEHLVNPTDRQIALEHIQSLHWTLLKMNLNK